MRERAERGALAEPTENQGSLDDFRDSMIDKYPKFHENSEHQVGQTELESEAPGRIDEELEGLRQRVREKYPTTMELQKEDPLKETEAAEEPLPRRSQEQAMEEAGQKEGRPLDAADGQGPRVAQDRSRPLPGSTSKATDSPPGSVDSGQMPETKGEVVSDGSDSSIEKMTTPDCRSTAARPPRLEEGDTADREAVPMQSQTLSGMVPELMENHQEFLALERQDGRKGSGEIDIKYEAKPTDSAAALAPPAESIPPSQGDRRAEEDEGREMARHDVKNESIPLSSKAGGDAKEGKPDRTNPPDDNENSRRFVRATRYGHRVAALVPEDIIPSHRRDDVLQVETARRWEREKAFELYTTHLPGYKRAYLDLSQLKGIEGEEFVVGPVKLYGLEQFCADYAKCRPKGLENTELVVENGRVALKVDDKVIGLAEPNMRTYQGYSVLDARLPGDVKRNGIKISEGVDGFTARLEDKSRVVSAKNVEGAVELFYERTFHESYPHVRIIKSESKEAANKESWQHRVEIQRKWIGLAAALRPEKNETQVRFSEECSRACWNYWASAGSDQERNRHQGDIGEAIADVTLRESGYLIVGKHLISRKLGNAAHESELGGRDLVIARDGEYYVVEVKHWRDSIRALKEAREDILRFIDTPERVLLEKKVGARLKGGLSFQIGWSYKEAEGVIYTDLVEF